MKKIFIILLLITAIHFPAMACDICGGGVSNYNPFLVPHLSKNYISLSYIHRSYSTFSETGIAGKENYNSLLAAGQYSVNKKTQLLVIVPFQQNKLVNNNGKKNVSGIGDISILANYKLLDKMMKLNRHTLMVGGGLKLATGKYTIPEKDEIVDQNFQLGSGSTDYLLNASYRFGYRQWAFNASGSYKYNTQNSSGFRYGDVFTTRIRIVKQIEFENFSVAPYTQAIHELQMKDAASNVIQDHSGGKVLYTGAGIDVNTKKIAAGINYQFAPQQHLAEGRIHVNPSFTAQLSIIL